MSRSYALIGYASGLAANNPGCANGPLQLKAHTFENVLLTKGIKSYWQAMLLPQPEKTRLIQVAQLNTQLAMITYKLRKQKQLFIVMGGDHSSAIGTWSGLSAAEMYAGNSIGLIWIDAHMDSHTFDTTPSGNIHGMPLAALLGYGDDNLTKILSSQPKLKPEKVSLIGVRSFEEEEAALLYDLGVRIYKMPEIKERGLNVVLQEAITRAKQGTAGFGVSLDLDGIDPNDAPGVGVPEPNGILANDLCQVLTLLRREKQLFGIEIVEYNPYLDENHKTEQLIHKIVLSIFGD
ncbi:MAG: arginase [Rickettsiella sp.]|nr:arginase [Rickettsiella sp.]